MNSLDFILNEQGAHLEVPAKARRDLTHLGGSLLWLPWAEWMSGSRRASWDPDGPLQLSTGQMLVAWASWLLDHFEGRADKICCWI